MNSSRAVSIILNRLGGKGPTSQMQDIIVSELNAAQEQFEIGPTFPWFTRKVADPELTVSAVSEVVVPNDYIALVEEYPITYVNGLTLVDLEARPYDELAAKFGHIAIDAGGAPAYYTFIDATRWRLYPRVSTGTLQVTYHAQQPLIQGSGAGSETGVNNWYRWAPFLLINKALYEIAIKVLRDVEFAQILKPDIADSLQQLIALSVTQDVQDRDFSSQFIRRRRE